jgi:hypothetical protein
VLLAVAPAVLLAGAFALATAGKHDEQAGVQGVQGDRRRRRGHVAGPRGCLMAARSAKREKMAPKQTAEAKTCAAEKKKSVTTASS